MVEAIPNDSLTKEALGLLIEQNGYLGDGWTSNPFETESWELLRKRFETLGIKVNPKEALDSVRQASEAMKMAPRCLYVCRGRKCEHFTPPANTDERASLAIKETGCQGSCEFSPRAALRFDGNQKDFRNLDATTWQDLLTLGSIASHSGTLLVDNDPALELQFDPMHSDSTTDLTTLGFLVGHFRGEGYYGKDKRPFSKEVIGSWVAKGTALALRMSVSYPLALGGIDSHQAFVVIGFKAKDGEYIGNAWTDSGESLEYRYEIDDQSGALIFSDSSPEHGKGLSARKSLVPEKRGYEERLEIWDDSSEVSLYSMVLLKRINSAVTNG